MSNQKWKMIFFSSLYLHLRHGRHSRCQQMLRIDLIGLESDFYGHALDDFHIATGRVLRRNQTEARARACLNTVHVAFETIAGISLERDTHPLTGLHVS